MAAMAEQRWHAALASLAEIRRSDLRHSELRRPAPAIRSVCEVTKSHKKSLVGGDWMTSH